MEPRTTRRRMLTGLSGAVGVGGGKGTNKRPTAGEEENSTGKAPSKEIPKRRVFLDSDRSYVGHVYTGAERQVVVRYENPVAGGIEVYAGGQRVEERPAVERTFFGLAWAEEIQRLLDRDAISRMNWVLDRTRRIESALSGPRAATGQVVETIDRLEELSVGPTSVWELATDVAPSLEGFEIVVRALDRELDEWVPAARAANDALPPLRSFLSSVERPRQADFERAEKRIARSVKALDTIEDTVGDFLDSIERTEQKARTALDDIENLAERIITEAQDRFGDDLFGTSPEALRNTLETATDALRAAIDRLSRAIGVVIAPLRVLERRTSELEQTVRPSVASRKQSLLEDWQQRRNANLKATTFPVVLTLFGLGLTLWIWTEPGASTDITTRLSPGDPGTEDDR